MKHIFIIHSHTLFLTSLGVIDKLHLKKEDVLFLFHRHYSTTIPFPYQWIDISEMFERSYYMLFSWSRKNFFYNKKIRDEVVAYFDEIVDKNVCDAFYLYTASLQAFTEQIIATNKKCKECFFIQEGGRAMISCMTDKIAWIWRVYNKCVLRNEKRFWKCTNWFPNKKTPYNKPITAFAFDDNFFCQQPQKIIHIEWPKVDIKIDINPNIPIFLLEGAVELGQVDRTTYTNAFKHLLSDNAEGKNYIKFHPMQTMETKKMYMSFFSENNLEIEELPMEIPFELILLKYKHLKLYGFGTSLLFYGKAMGHEVISYEKDLMCSKRYRLYANGLAKLQ